MDDAAAIPQRAESAPVVLAKLIGVFAIIGAGLGIGTVLFLWSSGVFDAHKKSLAGIGEAIAGGLIVAAALVFALLFGVVFSAVAGMHAASHGRDRATAALVGGTASAVGQIALIVTLGAVLIGGINFFKEVSQPPRSSPSLIERIDRGTGGATDEDTDVSVRDLSRLALGAVPAFVVGALSGGLVYSRRRVA